MPSDARALAATLPDTPCWVETRALLLSGAAIVARSASGAGAIVLDPVLPSGFLVGRPERALLREVTAGAPQRFELVVQEVTIEDVCRARPGWSPATATVFSPLAPWPPAPDDERPAGVVVSAPPDDRWLARVPQAPHDGCGRLYESPLRIGTTDRGRRETPEQCRSTQEASRMAADAGPPLVLMALGLVLWLAVSATVAGISIQTVGMILFVVGAIWLVVELIQARSLGRGRVVEEPVGYRDRRI